VRGDTECAALVGGKGEWMRPVGLQVHCDGRPFIPSQAGRGMRKFTRTALTTIGAVRWFLEVAGSPVTRK
jgi:hypothetical protein